MTREVYTAHQLAERWQVTVDHIYRKLWTKEINGFKVGGAWRVAAEEVSRIETGTPVAIGNPNYKNPFDRP